MEKFVRDRVLVYLKKNKDYGDSFNESIRIFPDAGRVRILDKVNRLKSLMVAKHGEVSDESIQDTILDLFNYAVMHSAWDEEDTSLSNIVANTVYFAEEPDTCIFYIKELLTVEDMNFGFDAMECDAVVELLRQLIRGE